MWEFFFFQEVFLFDISNPVCVNLVKRRTEQLCDWERTMKDTIQSVLSFLSDQKLVQQGQTQMSYSKNRTKHTF